MRRWTVEGPRPAKVNAEIAVVKDGALLFFVEDEKKEILVRGFARGEWSSCSVET